MDDYTQHLEDAISKEAERFSRILKEEIGKWRPVGSQKVSMEQQELEYAQMILAPQVMEQFLKDQRASVESAIIWAHRMNKRMNNGQNK